MSLHDAKRLLQWGVVTEALTDAGVDADTLALVEQARAYHQTISSMAQILLGGADAEQAKNYIKVEMVGMLPPFERAYVELVRPGGKTSHELRELLRDRLTHVRRKLSEEGGGPQGLYEDMIEVIDEDLAMEAP